MTTEFHRSAKQSGLESPISFRLATISHSAILNALGLGFAALLHLLIFLWAVKKTSMQPVVKQSEEEKLKYAVAICAFYQ